MYLSLIFTRFFFEGFHLKSISVSQRTQIKMFDAELYYTLNNTVSKVICHNMIDINMIRAGHVPTFLKSFRSFTIILSIFFRMRSKRSVFFGTMGLFLIVQFVLGKEQWFHQEHAQP